MTALLARVGNVSTRTAKLMFFWTIGLGALAAGIWAIVFSSINWRNGIYAGFHYDGARSYVQEVMARQLGAKTAHAMRLGVPDVVNTHDKRNLFGTSGQVRLFHLIGPAGVRYCVSVWDGGSSWYKDYRIVKGCTW